MCISTPFHFISPTLTTSPMPSSGDDDDSSYIPPVARQRRRSRLDDRAFLLQSDISDSESADETVDPNRDSTMTPDSTSTPTNWEQGVVKRERKRLRKRLSMGTPYTVQSAASARKSAFGPFGSSVFVLASSFFILFFIFVWFCKAGRGIFFVSLSLSE